MEAYRLQQRDPLYNFFEKLRDWIKYILGTIVFLVIALLALILLSAIYIPKLKTLISDYTN